MMKATTQNCNRHNHPEFLLTCDDSSINEARLKWLLEWLEAEVARGKQFLPQQTVQVGWSVLKVTEREDGTLGLLEPDFKGLPAKFVDSVSLTLLHLTLQKSVNESLGLEEQMEFSSLRHSAIVCADFGTTKEIMLNRTQAEGNDSGWFFGCDNDLHNHQTAENLKRVSLYEAAVALDDRIIPYLALPSGIMISLAGNPPRFFLKEEELSIKPNSFLHQKFSL